ncbi:MAG: LD-carboxypeptidase [Bacteroidetes bacterium]|nr:LD-carboxypeptidase [Bacteroidota bacterium]MBU1719420.1 LD-carboxypeptidase [Bacteroidota bacterium]
MITPPFLSGGDVIGVVSTARKVSESDVEFAFRCIEDAGFRVLAGTNLFGSFNQFSGSDEERVSDFQRMLQRTDVKAILCARGGYGTARIVDSISFDTFRRRPKWICGFSDVTVLHAHAQQVLNAKSLHCAMPLTFASTNSNSIEEIWECLMGREPHYQFESYPVNKSGIARGTLIGGNLSVLLSLIGSRSFPQIRNAILFLEDIDEYLYHIDRMMMALKRSGLFSTLSGMIIGGMSDMRDNDIPFGKTAIEIISDATEQYDFPIAFGFPAGHIPDNRPLIMGSEVTLDCRNEITHLFFH